MAADPEHERDETWEDVTFDEDFIRSAETTEPSARARMLAARLAERVPRAPAVALGQAPRGLVLQPRPTPQVAQTLAACQARFYSVAPNSQ